MHILVKTATADGAIEGPNERVFTTLSGKTVRVVDGSFDVRRGTYLVLYCANP